MKSPQLVVFWKRSSTVVTPSLVDAVLLRLWIGRRAKTPLAEIATAIIEAYSKQEHSS
jgi:hypothetical protein